MDEAVTSVRLPSDGLPAASSMVFSPSSSPAAPPSAGDFCRFRIPDHELLLPIAAGAYGEVWLARNVFGTLRAVKIVRRDRHESAESFEREFKGLQKFEPVSRAHEGLVDILTLGLLSDGAGFYYVMELADQAEPAPNPRLGRQSEPPYVGCYEPRTLRADLKLRSSWPADEVIALGLKLTAALAHLHAQRLVHRDVKPSNILFITGEPKLADAGLVAAADDARSLVGTAGYIAPEGPGTPQADVYALGKVLYEAAFGKDRQEFPALPPDISSRADHASLIEINAILLTACATDRRERYQSADEMRNDLELVHACRSVKRRRIWQRVSSLARKVGLVAAALAVVSGIAYWLSDGRKHSPESKRSGQLDFAWSTNAEAQEEFRKGQGSLLAGHTSQNSFQAIQHLQRAVELDPNFADAWAQLAGAWNSAAGATNQQANVLMAAERAVSVNPNSALANSMLASAKFGSLDWAGAEEARLRSVALAPNSVEILLRSALNLACTGRAREALQDLEKAQRAEPTSASNLRTIYSGYAYAWSGQYDRAIEIFNQFPDAGFWMKEQHAQAYLAKGDYTNAMSLQRQAVVARGGNPNDVNAEFDALEAAFKIGGKEAYWKRRLELEAPRTDDKHCARMAEIHAQLNQRKEAFEYLHQAKHNSRSGFAIWIYTNPSIESLRSDPQFRELIAELWRRK